MLKIKGTKRKLIILKSSLKIFYKNADNKIVKRLYETLTGEPVKSYFLFEFISICPVEKGSPLRSGFKLRDVFI